MKIRLQYWRKKRALSIKDLAATSGVSTSTIVNAEKNGTPPRPRVIQRLAAALEVSLDDLLLDDPEEKHNPAIAKDKENSSITTYPRLRDIASPEEIAAVLEAFEAADKEPVYELEEVEQHLAELIANYRKPDTRGRAS